MKILFIGLGSIGQRHLRNIRNLYGNSIECSAYRYRGLPHVLSAQMQIIEHFDVESYYSISSFDNLEEALSHMPDIAFITNITCNHIPFAIRAAEAGCHLFLEKPLSDSMDGVEELLNIVKQKNLITFVGYQNRYHPCLLKLKKCLNEGIIGNVISADVEMGECLKGVHSYEDYKTSYMARKDMGGGVILSQLIHELDYIQWLLGKPECVYATGIMGENLEIDVETSCSCIYKIRGKHGMIPIYAHGDFFQTPPSRRCKIIGDKGWVEANLLKNEISINCKNGVLETLYYSDFERNDMFITEIKDFMDAVQKGIQSQIPLEQGIISMRMALAAKKSMETGKEVFLQR